MQARGFVQSNIADCDEFASNMLHLNSEVLFAAKLDNVRNILCLDTS